MSKLQIIPAIDLMGGKVVRLSEGDFDTKEVYGEDPVAQAQAFEKQGITHLHLVDLDGAKAGKVIHATVLKAICSSTNLLVDYGGGIREKSQVIEALNAGANQVTIGSLAVKSPEVVEDWLSEFGTERFILAADVREGIIQVSGWMEDSEWELHRFVKHWSSLGVRWFLCTDISKDGRMAGPNVELYRELLHQFPSIELIASGGVSSHADIRALEEANVRYAVVGKAIYQGKISLS